MHPAKVHMRDSDHILNPCSEWKVFKVLGRVYNALIVPLNGHLYQSFRERKANSWKREMKKLFIEGKLFVLPAKLEKFRSIALLNIFT